MQIDTIQSKQTMWILLYNLKKYEYENRNINTFILIEFKTKENEKL